MKKLIISLSFVLSACGTGSSSHNGNNQSSGEVLLDCILSTADFSQLVGSYESFDVATQALMNWMTSIAVSQNCKLNPETAARSLGENITLSTDANGHVDVTLFNGA